MNNPISTEQRIAQILKKMRKAMPEIKRQIAVYEKCVATGTVNRPLNAPMQSKNV